jgi:hypothetical protein
LVKISPKNELFTALYQCLQLPITRNKAANEVIT